MWRGPGFLMSDTGSSASSLIFTYLGSLGTCGAITTVYPDWTIRPPHDGSLLKQSHRIIDWSSFERDWETRSGFTWIYYHDRDFSTRIFRRLCMNLDRSNGLFKGHGASTIDNQNASKCHCFGFIAGNILLLAFSFRFLGYCSHLFVQPPDLYFKCLQLYQFYSTSWRKLASLNRLI